MSGRPAGRWLVLGLCVLYLAALGWRLAGDRLELRAEELLWDGDPTEAMAAFETAADWRPLDPQPRTGRADAIFERAEERDLGSPEAIADLERAIAGYEEALYLAPGLSYAWSQLGRSYASLAVARRASGNQDISQLLASSRQQSKEDLLAARALRRAVDLEPNNYDFINFTGDFLSARGDAEGLDWYRRGARTLPRLLKHPYLKNPNLPAEIAAAAVQGAREAVGSGNMVPDGKILEEIALFQARRGDLADAIATNAEAIERCAGLRPDHPDLPWLWTRQGNWLNGTGDREAARRAVESALELDPGRAATHFVLGRLLAAEGDLEGGTEHFRVARNQVPGNLRFQMELARTVDRAGHLERAVQEYERALRIPGGEIPASMALVDLYRREGVYDEAIRHARTLVRLQPDEPAFERQLEELTARLQF